MKKISLIILFVFIFLSFNQVNAACPTGLVPCGTSDCPCQFCHLFVLFQNIVNFFLYDIVPPLAVLMIAIGGFMYMFAYFSPGQALPGGGKGGPALLSQAKKIITATIIGLLIIYGAWLVVNFFFQFIGVSTWQGWSLKESWWQIKCPTQ
jgi:hypothetical protein